LGKGEPGSQVGSQHDTASASGSAARDARLRLLTDQVPAVVWSTDRDLRFTSSTGAALRTLGLSPGQAVGASLWEYFGTHDRDEPQIAAHLRALAGESVSFAVEWNTRDFEGYVEPLRDESTAIVGTLGIAVDVTERKRAERERLALQTRLRHQLKLEAIGTLASGVAHEINNPIQSIMNYAQIIARRTPVSELQDYAGEILTEAQRVAAIVRNLLSFARQEGEPYADVPVSTLVESTLALMGVMLHKEGIVLEVDVSAGLPLVRCHPQQIQQVLMTLLSNARDALNERYPTPHDAKRVLITARSLPRDDEPRVRITVEDHGLGVPAERLERLFDPFARTITDGSDTAFGLAVSHSVVAEHGGLLSAESEPGRLTRFHVDLPVGSAAAV
jgi:PAS domain S-box-containing protein